MYLSRQISVRREFDLQLALGGRNLPSQCGVFILKLGIQILQMAFLSLGFAVVESSVLTTKVVSQPTHTNDRAGKCCH